MNGRACYLLHSTFTKDTVPADCGPKSTADSYPNCQNHVHTGGTEFRCPLELLQVGLGPGIIVSLWHWKLCNCAEVNARSSLFSDAVVRLRRQHCATGSAARRRAHPAFADKRQLKIRPSSLPVSRHTVPLALHNHPVHFQDLSIHNGSRLISPTTRSEAAF